MCEQWRNMSCKMHFFCTVGRMINYQSKIWIQCKNVLEYLRSLSKKVDINACRGIGLHTEQNMMYVAKAFILQGAQAQHIVLSYWIQGLWTSKTKSSFTVAGSGKSVANIVQGQCHYFTLFQDAIQRLRVPIKPTKWCCRQNVFSNLDRLGHDVVSVALGEGGHRWNLNVNSTTRKKITSKLSMRLKF